MRCTLLCSALVIIYLISTRVHMFTARFCGTDQPTGRAQALCRWEPHVCAPLGCQRSRGSMKRCQEMQSNEGMYSRRATQRESDWLVQGLCLAPFLCRRDWRHHAGSCLAKRKRKKKKKLRRLKEKLCFFILLRFKRAHAVLVEGRLIPAC